MRTSRNKLMVGGLAVLCVMLLSVPPPASDSALRPAAATTGTLRVNVVDVGQGDGTVWQLPDSSTIVFDCGPPVTAGTANPMITTLHSLGLPAGSTIHALIASHGHLDHIGGCDQILQEYRVQHVYEAWYQGADAPQSYMKFHDQLRAEGATLHVLNAPGTATPNATGDGTTSAANATNATTATNATSPANVTAPANVTSAPPGAVTFKAGDTVDLPRAARDAGVSAEILWPPSFQGKTWDDIAASSIAVRLSYGSHSFCFQGDVEAAQEQAMTQRLAGRGCDVYLMGHHGSRHASSASWLAALGPKVALVSFGNNTYGHPTSEALCRVQQAGARVYETHTTGTLTVETDGRSLSVKPDQAETRDACAASFDYWKS